MNRKQRRAEATKGGQANTAASSVVHPIFAAALGHHKAGRLAEAESLFHRVLTISPRHSDSLHMLGVIAHQTDRRDLAVVLIRKALKISPTDATLHSNLGNLMLDQGQLDEAIDCYRRAVALQPGLSAALNNLGNALRVQQRLDEAIDSYRKALVLKPNDPEVHYNLGMALLARGDMEPGWQEHEWRWKTPLLANAWRDFAKPQWCGDIADGRTLLIHAEQGFGDTLQFCRYASMAAAKGLRVILEVPKPLTRLLRSLRGVDELVVEGEPLPHFDFHCPMMSMPLALGTTITTIPHDVPYLSADANQISAWRTRLDAMRRHGSRVGLVWAGNPRKHMLATAAIERQRSMSPEFLAPLVELSGLHFLSLQKDGPRAPAHFPLTDFMDQMDDFADTAALIANLDLVISTDTSVAHLAAALGKPVWLLDRFNTCWRWLVGRRDSPWYPSLRIYRQPRPGDWNSVLIEVARDLRALAAA